MDLVAEVLASCARTPRATAIIDPRGRELSFGALRERVLRIRDRLAGAGFEPGQSVLYAVQPSPDAIAVALGAVAAGGTLVFADPGLAPGVLEARLRLARPGWVVAESFLYAITATAAGRALVRRRGVLLPALSQAAVRHAYTGRWLPGVPSGAVRLHGLDAPFDAALGEADLDAPAAVIFTSGTTAHPRAVVHTRRSLAAGLQIFMDRFPLGPGDVVHTDGLMLGLPALIGGATWSMPGSLDGRGVTHLYQVPVEAARLTELPGTVRHLLLGSAPAPPAVLRRCLEICTGEVHSVYAMTEALPIALAGAEEKLAYSGGDLLGEPLPGVGVRFTADRELVVSGPHVARGYLGEPPVTEVPTGDLARLDEQGRLVLLGRKKDMLLREGFNIYPSLYEPSIAALPGVREAALIGLPDPATGDEEVVLALVPGDGFQEQAVRRRLPEVMDAGALPDRIQVFPDFPRAGRSHKLDRPALRDQLTRPR
ncbi:class I adenylate-forming enzyme family protein [Nonomuraea sp. NPDC050328]|uniref:class I adenylate-forming enzyme family protein n=1 Tax=Nonomuraea sp. NPDC050328 TaxID=3364361 RepID=UPI00379273BE